MENIYQVVLAEFTDTWMGRRWGKAEEKAQISGLGTLVTGGCSSLNKECGQEEWVWKNHALDLMC